MNTNPNPIIFAPRVAEKILNAPNYSLKNIVVGIETTVVQIARKSELEVIENRKFFEHFRNTRRDKGRDLKIAKHRSAYSYQVTDNDQKFVINPEPNGLPCSCDDYQAQQKIGMKGICAHGYKVLTQMGYSTLNQYLQINAQKNRQTSTSAT